jgi:hypothetical protein
MNATGPWWRITRVIWRQDMKRLSALVVVIALLGAGPVVAHHSFSAEFDATQPITLRGTLTKMDWVNPHGWLYVDVAQPDGKVVNWAIEAGSPNSLLRKGLRKTDFPIGSEVVIEGYRARNGTATANGTTVKFADGRNFFLGVPPEGAAQQR